MPDANDKVGLSLHDLADTVLRAEYWKAVEAMAEAIDQGGGADAIAQEIRKRAFEGAKESGWLGNDDRVLQCLRYSVNRRRAQRAPAPNLVELAGLAMVEDVLDACRRRGLLS